jgi:hypothetical protein
LSEQDPGNDFGRRIGEHQSFMVASQKRRLCALSSTGFISFYWLGHPINSVIIFYAVLTTHKVMSPEWVCHGFRWNRFSELRRALIWNPGPFPAKQLAAAILFDRVSTESVLTEHLILEVRVYSHSMLKPSLLRDRNVAPRSSNSFSLEFCRESESDIR